jgi:DNA polymerase I-like protein with 3'-5' exonuclease and polymerase domains
LSTRNYGAVRSAENFDKFVARMIKQGRPVGFDIESSYSSPHFIEKGALQQFHPDWFLTGFSFTNSTDWARYVPIAHAEGNNVDDVTATARSLWRLLTARDAEGKPLIVAHNLSFEVKGCRRFFIDILWDDFELGEEVRAAHGLFQGRADSMLEVWLAAEYEPVRAGLSTKDLKGVTKLAFDHTMMTFSELFATLYAEMGKKPPKDKRFHLLDSTDPRVINYACEDAVWCLALDEKHYPEMKDQFIFNVEMELLPVLIDMEIEGLYLDWATIEKKATEVLEFRDFANEEILSELSVRLDRIVTTNLASPAQLQKVLYDPQEGLGLPISKRTETNQPSTDEEALRGLAKKDPVIKKILEWKEISKLHGSYLKKYHTSLNYAGNGRAYPNHNQAGALTGRMSVDHVPYQQWPKPYHYELASGRTYDLNFRDLLCAPEGYRIVGFDFSQVELRVLAGVAQEAALLRAFADDVDIHKATASSMMNIPLDEVTKAQRSNGKTLNFAVVYGSGAKNIAEMLTSPENPVTTEDAQELLEKYFAAFPGLKRWMDERVSEGRQQGYVETLFKRKFTLWEYRDSRDWIRAKGDRMCVNAPVQGGAADYLKIGMIRTNKAIKRAEADGTIPVGGIRLVMSVHDALEFYVHESVATQTVIDIVNPAVTFAVKGLPYIRADWHEGMKWGSVVELNLDKETKQILNYSIEDVDEIFDDIVDAYKHMADSKGEELPSFPASIPAMPEPKLDDAPKKNLEPEQEIEDDDEPVWAHNPEYLAMAMETQRIVITMSEMPDEHQWTKFEAFLKKNPGHDSVTVATPEGDLELDTKHALSADHQPQISLILGGASLTVAPENVNADELTVGISL